MKQYHELLHHILSMGEPHGKEPDEETISVFGYQTKFDLSGGHLPISTTNTIPFRWIVEELYWYIAGDTNTNTLLAKCIPLWSKWSTRELTLRRNRKEGDLGPFTGYLWRSFGGHYPARNGTDQLARLLDEIASDCGSRSLLLVGWNPSSCSETDAPLCHTVTQFHVEAETTLNSTTFFRSFDAFNYAHAITTYGLLNVLLAHVTDLRPGTLVASFGDLHLHARDLEKAREVLKREPLPMPTLELTETARTLKGLDGLLEMRYEHLRLHDYRCHPQLEERAA